MSGGFLDILSLGGLGAIPSGGPVVESFICAQRDSSKTFLVDCTMKVYDATGGGNPLQLVMQYSTTSSSGPWSPCTSQPYDRKHTVGSPAAIPAPVPTNSPGVINNFVWRPFFDLPEGDYPHVWLRMTVTDVASISDVVTFGPISLTTKAEVKTDPLTALLQRQAIAAASPLDFLGIGPAYPLVRGSRDFLSASGVSAVRCCIKLILRTRAAWGDFGGDLPWRPDFGNKLWVLRHRKNDPTLQGQALAFVQEAFLWEPRAQLTEVAIEGPPFVDLNTLQVRAKYQVITENRASNRVILPEFSETVRLAA